MLAGRAVDVVGPRRMILIGWFVYAVIYLAFGLAAAAWEVVGPFLWLRGILRPDEPAEKTLVANLVGKEFRGLPRLFNCADRNRYVAGQPGLGALYERFGALSPSVSVRLCLCSRPAI